MAYAPLSLRALPILPHPNTSKKKTKLLGGRSPFGRYRVAREARDIGSAK
jgi:hypothetical protein